MTRRFVDLQSAYHPGHVVLVQLRRRLRVDLAELFKQRRSAVFLRKSAKLAAVGVVALRIVELEIITNDEM